MLLEFKLKFFFCMTRIIFTIKKNYQSFLNWAGINLPIFIIKLFCDTNINSDLQILSFSRFNKKSIIHLHTYQEQKKIVKDNNVNNILRLCWFFKYCQPLLPILHIYCNHLTPRIKTDCIEIIYWIKTQQLVRYKLNFEKKKYTQYICSMRDFKKETKKKMRVKFNKVSLKIPKD